MVAEHNLESYEAARESFDWTDIYTEADWDAPEEINVAHEVCDRHVAGGDRIALRQVGVDGEWYLSGDLAHKDEDGYF